MSKTTEQYDIIFMDVFSEESIPVHLNTEQFFTGLRHILNDHGCLSTNANVSPSAFHQLTQVLSSTFSTNILLAHNNILENARVIMSGDKQSLRAMASKEQAIDQARQFQFNAHLEFNLAQCLLLVDYNRISGDPSSY